METLSQCTILLVDDTEENIDVLVEILGDYYELAVAMDGESALEIAKEDLPDLILLDIMMPDMDGYEVCKRLKEAPETADIPVVFVTAKSETSDEAQGFDLGAVDYITKPISPAVVKARVKTHLALEITRKTLAEQNKELIEAAQLQEAVDRISRHDLKNPLTTILSVPQLLMMDDNVDEQQKEMLGRVEQAGLTMLNMINLSLDLFKMERGTYQLTPVEVDLAGVIRWIYREHGETAASLEVPLKLMIEGAEASDDAVFSVPGEELLLYSMLGNLVKNGLEATPEGQELTISLSQGDPITIAMENSGEVLAEVRDSFFEKYATAGKNKGTGLGTYSAKLIAETHKGTIGFESGNGKTTVTVSLPT